MAKMTADSIDREVRSAFPPGTIKQVQVLEYGDDPEIEPGQTAVRIFIDQAPPRPDIEPGTETLHRFVRANREAVRRLRHEQPSIGWVEFRLGDEQLTTEHGPAIRTGRQDTQVEAAAELTSVMTRLGPEDLATVDTLITAGIANSRAEVLRWALGRIREHSAYAQIQERVREISELKAQF
jgi:Arc/MetJ-type ribon-helix-helix transcriptional regulator